MEAKFDKLLQQVGTSVVQQGEEKDAILGLKRTFPKQVGQFDQENVYGILRKLQNSGFLGYEDGGTKVLQMLVEKFKIPSRNKEVLSKQAQEFNSSFPTKKKFVGREDDIVEITNFLFKSKSPGVNMFGDSGVGKTTLAKEVSTKLEQDFESIFIDLRGTNDTNTVYFKVLEKFNLTPWDYNKERIYTHLQNLTNKILLILDNVEKFLSNENEVDQKRRKEFLDFLRRIVSTKASEEGSFKVILTSKIKVEDSVLDDMHNFSEHEVPPLTKEASRQLMSWRLREEPDDEQETLNRIADLCRNNPYFLERAEQLLRQNYLKPSEVLKKLNTSKNKGVPEQFACISELFESLPSDEIRQVAVKISLLQRPFSVSTAMKITNISSDYDAEFNLELLVTQKVLTAVVVNEERKYDLHALFREFVIVHLCKEVVFKDLYREAEYQFVEHFSGKLKQLSDKLEKDFVQAFKMLEEDKPNFEQTISSVVKNELFDFLFYSEDLKDFDLMFVLLKYVVNNQNRKNLFKKWSENAEQKGNLLIGAYMKCWEALLTAEMEGTTRAFDTLNQARVLLARVHSVEESKSRFFGMAQGMYLFCRGHLKYQECENLTDRFSSKTKKMTKKLLHEALGNLEESLVIHRRVYGDHSLTARSLDLMGNCYMLQFEPEKAEFFYQEAMEMKLKLIGSEKHDDIVHFYNQLSQVHQMMGDKIMQGPFDLKKVMGPLLPYKKRAKKQYVMAADLLKIALALQKDLGVCDTEDTATFQRNIANLYIALEKYDEALEYAKKSYKTRFDLLKYHPETVRILYLTGIIHEWREDRKAALESYEEAFAMEESLPDDNHSVVRKLLCDRLQVMCKKLNKKDKLKEYGPRIKAIMQIKRSTSVTEEPATRDLPAIGERDDYPETAEEPATEEEVPGHPIQGDIPEETPVSYTQAGTQQGNLPDVSLPVDEPGTADTEPLVQEDLPDVPLPVDEPGTADTEPLVQEDLLDVPLPVDEPGTADTEPLVQGGLPDVPLPVDEPGTADTEPIGILADELPYQHHMINPEGGTLDFPKSGIRLDIPKHAVTQATTVTHRNYTAETLHVTSPAGKDETVVSYVVGLEPSTLQLNKPIIVSMMHSGPGEDYGYETIVKVYNQDNELWEERKDLDRRQEYLSVHRRRDSIQVQISKLTILAAVTRLITDRFHVTPTGCVVRSSVCHDVTVEFPEGAVDKTLEGTLKLLPMPNDIHDRFNVYACPMLSLKGFENVELLKSVTIQMPHPCPEKYSKEEVRLVRLENNGWQEVKDPKIDVEDAYIKLQAQHFCWLSLMIPIGGTAVAVASAYKLFKYLRQNPQEAFIAASRDIIQPALQMKLHCLPSYMRRELDNERLLGGSTVEKPLRPGEKAFTKIKGSFVTDPDAYVTFLENQKEFVKILNLRRKIGNAETQEQLIRLVFYKKENEDPPLCEFSIEEEKLGNAPAGTMRLCHDVREIPNLSDEQKRWIVVGICLNKTLLPALRDFLKQEMEKHYNDLKAKHSIENQTHMKHLKKDGKYKLSYKSINKNKTKKKPRLFDYNVKSAEDLGKMYLMPYMAKFTDYDDACDMSAVLGILSSATVFSAKVQKLAKEVKNNVRNLWGHCNFKEWTDAKFSSCCQLMQSLVQALKLPDDHEKRIIDELGAWETKGVGADSVAEFIEFAKVEIERLSEDVKRLEANQKEQAEQIAAALYENLEANQEEDDEERALLLHERFDEDQKSDDEEAVKLQQCLEARQKEDKRLVATFVHIIKTLVKDNKHRDEKIDVLSSKVAALEQSKESSDKKIEVLENRQEILAKEQEIVEQKLKDITSSTDEEPVECFGILITNGNFQDIPEDIVRHMRKYIDDDIPGKENGQWKPEKFLRRFPSRSIDVPRSDCLQKLLECLEANYLKAMSHMIELLSVGKVIVHTPLKENQELTEEIIEIVSSNLNCSWEDMAGHLKVSQEIVKRCKEEDSVDTHKVTTRKMVRQWIEGVNDSCTLEVVFDALRLCRDRNTGEHLAVYTTEYIRKIIAQP